MQGTFAHRHVTLNSTSQTIICECLVTKLQQFCDVIADTFGLAELYAGRR